MFSPKVTKFFYVSGPGCSSVGYGATQEIGPFIVDTDGQGLKFNPYSWTKGISSLFFLDFSHVIKNSASMLLIIVPNFKISHA